MFVPPPDATCSNIRCNISSGRSQMLDGRVQYASCLFPHSSLRTSTDCWSSSAAPRLSSDRWSSATPRLYAARWSSAAPRLSSDRWSSATPRLSSDRWSSAAPRLYSDRRSSATPLLSSDRLWLSDYLLTDGRYIQTADRRLHGRYHMQTARFRLFAAIACTLLVVY